MKIAFHNPKICIRGTSNALFDYANFNELLLKNKSIIVVPKNGFEQSDKLGLEKYLERFEIFVFNDLEDLEKILLQQGVNVLYCIKYGKNDNVYSKRIKTVIHCVFDMSEPHGDVYAGVSKSLASKFNNSVYVPHMISLIPSKTKDNLRLKLNIPENAIVFGRYGGINTFDLQFCWKVIVKILNDRKDIYFIFINTPKFYKHDRIIHLPNIYSETDKNLFICTCDAHLECGSMGHSFGIAIGEFSVNNKPIIAYNGNIWNTLRYTLSEVFDTCANTTDEPIGPISELEVFDCIIDSQIEQALTMSWNTSHLDILGDKGLYFKNEKEFYDILNTFDSKLYSNINCFQEYNPENVMKQFSKVFLS